MTGIQFGSYFKLSRAVNCVKFENRFDTGKARQPQNTAFYEMHRDFTGKSSFAVLSLLDENDASVERFLKEEGVSYTKIPAFQYIRNRMLELHHLKPDLANRVFSSHPVMEKVLATGLAKHVIDTLRETQQENERKAALQKRQASAKNTLRGISMLKLREHLQQKPGSIEIDAIEQTIFHKAQTDHGYEAIG